MSVAAANSTPAQPSLEAIMHAYTTKHGALLKWIKNNWTPHQKHAADKARFDALLKDMIVKGAFNAAVIDVGSLEEFANLLRSVGYDFCAAPLDSSLRPSYPSAPMVGDALIIACNELEQSIITPMKGGQFAQSSAPTGSHAANILPPLNAQETAAFNLYKAFHTFESKHGSFLHSVSQAVWANSRNKWVSDNVKNILYAMKHYMESKAELPDVSVLAAAPDIMRAAHVLLDHAAQVRGSTSQIQLSSIDLAVQEYNRKIARLLLDVTRTPMQFTDASQLLSKPPVAQHIAALNMAQGVTPTP